MDELQNGLPRASPEAVKMLGIGRAWPLGGSSLSDPDPVCLQGSVRQVRIHLDITFAFLAQDIPVYTRAAQPVSGMIWGSVRLLRERLSATATHYIRPTAGHGLMIGHGMMMYHEQN